MWRPESVYDPSGHLDEGVVHGWLDGALADESAQEVQAHVASCAECAARIAEARGLIAGAARVLGALDGETSGLGRTPSALRASAGVGRAAHTGAEDSGGSDALDARRPTLGARRRWTTRRIGLAAAAVLVFAAGTVVLRDELGGGRRVREAIVGERATSAESAADERDFAAAAPQMAPEVGTGAAAGPGMANAGEAANAAPSAGVPKRRSPSEGRIAGRSAPAPPPPMVAAPATVPSGPPAPAPAPAAPSSAVVGSLTADASSPTVRADARPTAQRAPDLSGGATARGADRRSGVEATVATGGSGFIGATKPATSPQRIEGGELLVAPTMRNPGAWVLGCWRVAGSDTLLQFDRGGLAARAHGPAGDWHGAIRISPTTRSVVEWRLDGDSTSPARVRHWNATRDLLLWPGRDSLEAAVVPNADRGQLAVTEQQRIARDARRRGRSAAYERRLVLVRQEDRSCSP